MLPAARVRTRVQLDQVGQSGPAGGARFVVAGRLVADTSALSDALSRLSDELWAVRGLEMSADQLAPVGVRALVAGIRRPRTGLAWGDIAPLACSVVAGLLAAPRRRDAHTLRNALTQLAAEAVAKLHTSARLHRKGIRTHE